MLRCALQVWLPVKGGPPWDHVAARLEERPNLRAAFWAYRGDVEVVFTSARGAALAHRIVGGMGRLVVPSNAPAKFEVYHVGSNGFVSGRRPQQRFGSLKVHGLLDCWLRATPWAGDTAVWPAPVRRLFPRGPSAAYLEILREEQSTMVTVSARGDAEHADALRDAMSAAYPFVADAYAFEWDAYWAPLLLEYGVPGLFGALQGGKLRSTPAMRRALGKTPTIAALQKFLDHDDTREIMEAPVRVRRAVGVVGLFWALLLDKLEQQHGYAPCGRCGLPVPRPRTWCISADGGDCAKKQARERKRKERRLKKPAGRLRGTGGLWQSSDT